MRLLAAGRASEVYDLGNGRVLRRFKNGGDPEREAAVMRLVRSQGFPAPAVLAVRPGELELERLDGPTMLADLARRPWRLVAHARTLAALHRALHRIAAPPDLAAAGEGDALLHLDLHPANVVLTRAGPVVIDWTNARRGDPMLDVAVTWVILASSEIDGPARLRAGRALFTRAFLLAFDRTAVAAHVRAAADLRLGDPNVRPAEREAVRRLASRLGPVTR